MVVRSGLLGLPCLICPGVIPIAPVSWAQKSQSDQNKTDHFVQTKPGSDSGVIFWGFEMGRRPNFAPSCYVCLPLWGQHGLWSHVLPICTLGTCTVLTCGLYLAQNLYLCPNVQEFMGPNGIRKFFLFKTDLMQALLNYFAYIIYLLIWRTGM